MSRHFPALHRPLGALGTVSALGAGACLGDCGDADDARYAGTVAAALRRGVTLVDTAINYRCQRAERAVGRALREVPEARVVVCTRGGYIPLDSPPPDSKEDYRAYVAREYVATGLVGADDLVDGGHCIAPRFLMDQIARSRRNLGRERIDLYYLHNPERQLDHVSRDELLRRLRLAFTALEEAVAAGAIGAYGCATWDALRVPGDHAMHLELEAIVEAARDVAGSLHHLVAVQLPINLAMAEAVRLPTQRVRGEPCTLLQAARLLGVAVVAAAPLMQGRLTRGLPREVQEAFPSATTDAQRALAFVASLPGVACVPVGMRSEAHLTENLSLFGGGFDTLPGREARQRGH